MSETPRTDKQNQAENRKQGVFASYRFEIILAVVVLLGIFLLFERFSIRQSLMRWFGGAARSTSEAVRWLALVARDFLAQTTLSDAVGYLLVLAAIGALLWRLRWRLLRNARLTTAKCPRCGGQLRRMHRAPTDRLINQFIPVRRYRCADSECAWHGLRVGNSDGR